MQNKFLLTKAQVEITKETVNEFHERFDRDFAIWVACSWQESKTINIDKLTPSFRRQLYKLMVLTEDTGYFKHERSARIYTERLNIFKKWWRPESPLVALARCAG